jgi:MoaA/NifB/PqqE/SkfB family radical SAM enzyme
MKKLPVLARLAGYRLERACARATGARARQLPINLTVSVTYSCPSRCKTCDIWRKRVSDLTVDEYAKIFPTLKKVPIWVTLSGGDQFVRRDLDEIVRLVRTEIEPSIINLPMNGVITGRIHQLLPKIAAHSVGSSLVLNLSVDEIGDAHDALRGVKGNWDKLLDVARLIRDLQKTHDHIVMGVHTVISKYNVHRIPEIEREVRAVFAPDSYITEVAENRVELGTLDKDIAPSAADYRRAVAHLKDVVAKHRSMQPVARLVQSLRLEYYDLAVRTLDEKRQVIDCYAGRASAHLAPDGALWGCCVRAESMGNVRDHGYDFGEVWCGAEAEAFLRSVENKECACPLANASYTNMLLDPKALLRVALNMARP